MLADEVVAYGDFLSQGDFGKNDWLTIEATKDDSALIVTRFDLDPHPFALAGLVVPELGLNKISGCVFHY